MSVVELLNKPGTNASRPTTLLPCTSKTLERLNAQSQELFWEFLTSSKAAEILSVVQNFKSTSPAELHDFTNVFVGRVFEELAASYISSKRNGQSRPATIITSGELVDIYARLFHEAKVQNSYGLLKNIEGVTTPDLLEIQECAKTFQAQAYYEVTLGIHDPKFRKQLHHYTRKDYLRENFFICGDDPQISSESFYRVLRRVKPEFGNNTLKPLVFSPKPVLKYILPAGLDIPWNGPIIEIPISTQDIGKISNAIFKDYWGYYPS